MTADAGDYARSTLVAEYQAVEHSIEVARLKREGDDAVVGARFQNRSGRHVRAMVGLHEVDGAWRDTGGFAGSDSPVGGADAAWSTGGWSSSGRRSVRGFWVAHPSAVSLRLTDPAGRVHEDSIEGGVALLISDGDFDATRSRVELLDTEGNVVKAGPVWPAPSLID